MNEKDLQYWKEYGVKLIETHFPKVILGLVVLIVGWWLINRFTRLIQTVMEKRETDPMVIPFVKGLASISLKIMLIISVASMMGIAITGFLTALGAAGLAIGLALQGSLANFAGGLLILIFKPFKVGDLIETDGSIGIVNRISLLYTVITTLDDNTTLVPNGIVANSKVVNFTKENDRRIDLEVGVGYSEDVDKVKEILKEALLKVEGVLSTPEPFISILSFGDSSVNLAVRPYCHSLEYLDVFFRSNEAIKKALQENDIEIPFPQREVMIKGEIPK